MTAPGRPPCAAAASVLGAGATVPVALAATPPGVGPMWGLLLVVLSGGAAGGAGRWRFGRAQRAVTAVALLATGFLADLLWRMAIGEIPGAPGVADLTSSTLLVGGCVAGAFLGGHRLQAACQAAAEYDGEAGRADLALVLLAVCTFCLAVAGWTHPGLTPGQQWLNGLSLLVCTVTAAGLHLSAKWLGLQRRWAREQRRINPDAGPHRQAVAAVLAVTTLVLIVVWLSPPNQPVREAAERTPRQLAASLLDRGEQGGARRPECYELADGMWSCTVERDTSRIAPTPANQTASLTQAPLGRELDPNRPPIPGAVFVDGPPGAQQPGRPAGRPGTGAPVRLLLLSLGAVLVLYLVLRHVTPARPSLRWSARPFLASLARRAWRLLRLLVLSLRVRRPDPVSSREPQDPPGSPAPPSPPRPELAWPAADGARMKVVQHYGQVLQAADQAGMGRRPNQTPGHYTADLLAALPAHRGEVAEITERFHEARYSTHPITDDQAHRTARAGLALRRAIRGGG